MIVLIGLVLFARPIRSGPVRPRARVTARASPSGPAASPAVSAADAPKKCRRERRPDASSRRSTMLLLLRGTPQYGRESTDTVQGARSWAALEHHGGLERAMPRLLHDGAPMGRRGT